MAKKATPAKTTQKKAPKSKVICPACNAEAVIEYGEIYCPNCDERSPIPKR